MLKLRSIFFKVILLLFVVSYTTIVFAEQRKNCSIALSVCDTTGFRDTITGGSFGSGGNDFGAGGPTCTDIIELTPFWYQFIPTVDGPLEMGIFPSDSADDWEWALFDITAGCGGANWINIACNDSTPNCGPTGISTIEMARDTCNGGSTSPQNWVANVMLTKGRIYALMITGDQALPPGLGASFEVKFNFNNIAGHPNFGVEANITPQGPTTFCLGDSVQLLSDTTLSYQWLLAGSPIIGATNIDYFAKTSGSYQVEATDVIACVDTSAVEIIIANIVPVASISPLGPLTICSGDSTALTASPNGGGESYQWYLNGGILAGETNMVHQAKLAGNYTVVVTNLSGCPDSTTTAVNLTVNPTPTASIAPLGPLNICIGDSIALTASPNGGGESYQWYLNGGVLAGEINSVHQAKVTGNYTVVVRTALGCPDSLSTAVVLTVNPLPTASITPLGPFTICSGDSVTLTASPNGAGESYQWYLNGGTLVGETNFIHQAKLTGNYTVVVTTVSGCSDSTTTAVNLTVNPTPVASIAPLGPFTICSVDSVTLTASPNGGGESYQWYLNGGVLVGETNMIHQAKVAGNYTVVVRTALGCPDSVSTAVVLTVNPTPTASITPLGPETICSGDSIALTASPNGAGESYQWYLNGGVLVGETNMTHQAKIAGNYTVVVTTALGCPDSVSTAVVLTVNPSPTASITPLGPFTICSVDSVTLTASPNGGGESYQWYLNGGILVGETNMIHQARLTGNYTVIVTTALGCPDSVSTAVVLTVNPTPIASIAPLGPLNICAGDSVALTASPNGGGESYQWYLNGGILAGETNFVHQAKVAGNYTVVVRTALACPDSTTTAVNVTVNPFPTASIAPSGPFTICSVDSVTLTASPSGGGESYQWYLNGGILVGETNMTHQARLNGNYTVIVTTVAGCADSTTTAVSVTVNPSPTASIAPLGPLNICAGDSVALTASPNGGGESYQWYLNGGILVGETNFVHQAKVAGNYTVVVRTALACPDSTTIAVNVTVNAFPTASIAPLGPLNICAGDSIALTASPNGGGESYQWYLNGGILVGETNFVHQAKVAGNYTIIVTSVAGCADSLTTAVNVTVNANPVAVVVPLGPDTICNGDSMAYTSNPANSYQWYRDGILLPGETNQVIQAKVTGDYTIVVTNGSGCSDSLATAISLLVVNSIATITPVGPTTVCLGDSVELISSVAQSYQWLLNGVVIPGATNINYFAKVAGNYQVAIIFNTCPDTSAIEVIGVDGPNSKPVALNDAVIICEDDSAMIDVQINDTDADLLDILTTTIIVAPLNGTATVINGDSVRYVPNLNFIGQDTFTYVVCDSNLPSICDPIGNLCDTAMVFIDVQSVSDKPIANIDFDTACSGTILVIDVQVNDLDPDGDTLNTSILIGPSSGIASVMNGDSISYTPNIGFTGFDTIVYVVCDSTIPSACNINTKRCDTSFVFITVYAINSGAPIFAVTDNASMCEDDTVVVNVQTNDINPSGLPLLTSIIVSPDNGQVAVLNNDSIIYIPNPNYYGRDTIVYQICNLMTVCDIIPTPVCDIGLILIDINRINEPQVAVTDSIILCEADTAYILPMLNDSNIDNDTLVMSIILPAPSNGTVLQIGNDTLRYIANAGFSGNDTIYYQTVDTNAITACNPNGSFTDTGMIVLTVDRLNRAPLTIDTSTSTCMNTSIVINISTLISEPDDDSIMLFALLDTSTGVVGIINRDSIIYDPKMNYTGLDSIEIVICDLAPTACGVGTLCDTFLLTVNVFFDATTCDTGSGGGGPGNPLIIPNGISPNNDGVNDVLFISNIGDYSVVDVEIFNRWGNKVYANTDYQNDWGGTSKKGGDLPDGTYFYIIKTFEPAETIYKGYIQIHR